MIFAALLLLSSAASQAADSPPGERPNVVIMLADDLGYGDLGCYGHPQFKTPRIDRLAAEGARLTQFNTPAPFCAPTRASLMTGRYPFRCGLTQNPAPDGGPAADALALPKSEVTLAQMLRAAGYATGMVGKWHLGHKPGSLPTERGFDEYYGIPYSNDMRPVQVLDGTQVAEYPVVQATLTQRYTDRAVRFIERNKARPFFLYFAHAMPHKPLAAVRAALQEERRRAVRRCVGRTGRQRGRGAGCLADGRRRRPHARLLHQRQRPLVRRQQRRPARHEGQHLGRRLPRAADRPLAGADSRGPHQRPAGRDDGRVRHRAEGHRRRDARRPRARRPRYFAAADRRCRSRRTRPSSATAARGWPPCGTPAGSCTYCPQPR